MGQKKNEKGKYFEINKNKTTTYQNLEKLKKQCLEKKLIALNTYIKKKNLKH